MTRGRRVSPGPLFDEQPYGGVPPHQKHSDTSIAAAISQLNTASTKRARVYRLIKAAEAEGLTDDELDILTGWGDNTIRPRRRELVLLKVIEDSGQRRITSTGSKAAAWVVRDGD